LRVLLWPRHFFSREAAYRFRKGVRALPRTPRVVVPDHWHFVTLQGIPANTIFFTPDLQTDMAGRLVRILQEENVEILYFRFAENGAEFILKPRNKISFSKLWHRINTGFAMFYNVRLKSGGPVFRWRFRSVPLTDEYAATVCQDQPEETRNPRRMAALGQAWLKLAALVRVQRKLLFATLRALASAPGVRKKVREQIQEAEPGCRPCGPEAWIQALERTFNRCLRLIRPRAAPHLFAGAG
jgi:hypothetical protein